MTTKKEVEKVIDALVTASNMIEESLIDVKDDEDRTFILKSLSRLEKRIKRLKKSIGGEH